MSHKKHNQQERNRRQCLRYWRLYKDGMSVKKIAELVGKTEKRVSSMLKIGERFSE